MTAPLRTTCPYCGVGCGVAVEAGGGITGDPLHPANYGRLCSKGAALRETLGRHERLLAPLIAGRDATWDEALGLVARKFRETIDKYGPDAVAFYVSGQFLTEDYYVANKLMKGFIGAANIDTNSRLCMASSVAGHVRAFGEDIVPGCYEDLEEADLAILVGSNMAWCHPVLYQRLMAAREKRGARLVVIDPRRTPSAEAADLHLALGGSGDVLLFDGLLAHLDAAGAIDRAWVERHVAGFAETLAAARAAAPTIADVARRCGVALDDLKRFYDLFARNERVVTLYSQGVNQSRAGTDKVNAILNCHLATGRIGRPGMGPFSLTGQPNAMGGREVGGLANQLAAHRDFSDPDDIDRVRRFWRAPKIATRPGLKAVDLFEAVADGRIKALWIAATNPAASMPRAGSIRAGLERCPFVVVSDCWPTDTSARAHVVLPAAGWGEKDGTVTNSERRISRQRAFRSPPGAARADWRMFAEVGQRMGWPEAFAFENPAAIFREHAALSAFENNGRRIFDLGALATLDDAAYDQLEPTLWPCPQAGAGASAARLFADGGFATEDRRARMVPTPPGPDVDEAAALTLNTGRIRDQWHTMTRTGRVPHLLTHIGEPLLDIHPRDAAAQGLADGGLAGIESEDGGSILRVQVTARQRPGEIFAPIHWTGHFASAGPIGRLVTARADPLSGQPDLKRTAVRVRKVAEFWRGLLFLAERPAAAAPPAAPAPPAPALDEGIHWTKVPLDGGIALRLSGLRPLREIVTSEDRLREMLHLGREAELVVYLDHKNAVFRYAGIVGERLAACLFLAPPDAPFGTAHLPPYDRIAPRLGEAISPAERFGLLAGQASDGLPPPGPVVCTCFAVGAGTLAAAIRARRVTSLDEIGAAYRAGSNCGSCIPELQAMLREGARA